jgi:hypothetical protein
MTNNKKMKERTLVYLLTFLFFSPALFAQKATPKKLAVTQLEQILEQKPRLIKEKLSFPFPKMTWM